MKRREGGHLRDTSLGHTENGVVGVDSEHWSFFRAVELPHVPNLATSMRQRHCERGEERETLTGSPVRSEKVATKCSSKGLQRMPLTFLDMREDALACAMTAIGCSERFRRSKMLTMPLSPPAAIRVGRSQQSEMTVSAELQSEMR
jgi:hypothetical protein